MGDLSIGQRIAIARRRRGMSQAQVSGPLGKSVQWLSNIERGVRSADRYSILVPIAEVIGATVAELTGAAPLAAEPPTAQHDTAATLRRALSESGFVDVAAGPRGGGSMTTAILEELSVRVRGAWALVHEARYGDLGRVMPELLRECEGAARTHGPGRPDALRLFAELYQAVAAVMAKLGEVDAAWVAADRSMFAATEARDIVLAAAGSFRLGHAFLNAGRPGEARRAAAVALTALEPQRRTGDREVVALCGALLLVGAVAAARAGDRDAALSAMARAYEAAALLGPDYIEQRFETEFGTRNVALHAIAVAVELGDMPDALRRSSGIDTAGLSAERRARLLVDMARAHTQRRRSAAAVKALEDAERLAPEMVRSHRLARETVRELLRRERGRSKTGRLALAARMGIL